MLLGKGMLFAAWLVAWLVAYLLHLIGHTLQTNKEQDPATPLDADDDDQPVFDGPVFEDANEEVWGAEHCAAAAAAC